MKSKHHNIIRFAGLLFVIAVFCHCQLSAQVIVTRITGPESLTGKKGLTYNLPRTVLFVDVWITKTQQIEGPLAAYAGDYLGVNNVPKKISVNYAITDAEIRSMTEPDPGQFYLIQKEEKASGEIWLSFGRNVPVIAMEKFDKAITPPGFVKWNETLFMDVNPEQLFRKYSESPSREMVDTIRRKVSIDTLVIEEVYIKHFMEEYSDEEKAREAVDKIKQIDNDQYNLLIGYQETAYSLEALEFMIRKLEEQKQEYVRLFTGIELIETLQFEFTVIPDPENEEGEYVLAGFSETAGITEPVGQNLIKLVIGPENDADKKTLQNLEVPELKGLVYRLPKTVPVSLSFLGRELAVRRIGVLQLSPVMTLPSEFKRVEFDAETGALRSLVIE